jgi:hypothetical protein
MWDPTQIMAAIDAAKDDLGEPVKTVEVSVVGEDLRLALRDDAGSLLAVYSVPPGGEPTQQGA